VFRCCHEPWTRTNNNAADALLGGGRTFVVEGGIAPICAAWAQASMRLVDPGKNPSSPSIPSV
jgi:hypothetical protein